MFGFGEQRRGRWPVRISLRVFDWSVGWVAGVELSGVSATAIVDSQDIHQQIIKA